MFSERLKKLRKEKGMTQAELADALGISTPTVIMWENGKRKPQFEMLEKLSEVFDDRFLYLIGSTDQPTAARTEKDVDQLADWAIEEDYEDMLRRYTLLDDYGKATIDSVLRTEFNRCQEQGTLYSGMSIAVSVRSKPIVKRDITEEYISDMKDGE